MILYKKKKKEAKRASAVKKIEKRLKLMITGPERERERELIEQN